jgi:ABC-type uncharacterized transport system fused permease/ATPase subunit
LTFVLIK